MNRKPKPWLLILLPVAVVFCFAGILHLMKPLPPPNVSLGFMGFTNRGTNMYALVSLKNEGQTLIWPVSAAHGIIETKGGWITNCEQTYTTIYSGITPSSNEVFWIRLPADTLQWRADASFHYYKHHHTRFELADRIGKSHSHFWNRVTFRFAEAAFWCLSLLPEPKEIYDEISTPVFTNMPPDQASLSSKTEL